MEFLQLLQAILMAGALFLYFKAVNLCWVLPGLTYRKLLANGFSGPKPSFPSGNASELKKIVAAAAAAAASSPATSSDISNDIHSIAFPYFSYWKKLHGDVFVYWLGTEPFLYIADPIFLNKISAGILGKDWGKPSVLRNHRKPMFGKGLAMVEGEDWLHHRNVITPAFSPANLKAMSTVMVESASKMVERWGALVKSGNEEVDIEKEMIATAGEIITKTSFGVSHEHGWKVVEKLTQLQITLSKSSYVGVPFGKYLCPRQTLASKMLGKEIDALLLDIVNYRIKNGSDHADSGSGSDHQRDLLGLLVEGQLGKTLTSSELVDECKTFFFAGHETTALALTWTMLLLAMQPEWQLHLRQEIQNVMGESIDGGHDIDLTKLAGLKKMEWVMNEVMRLYSTAPNVLRQAKEDIKVDDNVVIPRGTNLWIDTLSIHHDEKFWGEDVHEFKPERFEKDGLYGGCKHKMGFLPFGFSGRMCIGRNLAAMEYKIVLTLILMKFSVSLSPNYRHAPSIILSLRPREGLPLILTPLHE